MAVRSNRWFTVAIVVAVVAVAVILTMLVLRRPTVVPDVVREPVTEATRVLELSGFRVGTTSRLATGSLGADLVVEQSPPGSSTAPRGSSVDITIAVQPTMATVPDVAGLESGGALQTIRETLYLPRPVDVFGDDTPGIVLGQAPKPGVSWMTGRPVALAVAAGPDDGTAVEVPDLDGESIQGAYRSLGEAGLVGYDFVRDLMEPEANVVVMQLPEAGLLVRPGTPVLLLFALP